MAQPGPKDIEKERIQYTIKQLTKNNKVVVEQNDTTIKFLHEGNTITIFPYTGWFSGKGIVAGRGIHNLLRQFKK